MAITLRTRTGAFARRGSRARTLRAFSNGTELFGAARTSALARVRKIRVAVDAETRAKTRKVARVERQVKADARTAPTPVRVAKAVKRPKRRPPGPPPPPPETERPNRAVAREVPRGFGRFVENLDNLGNRNRGQVYAQVEAFFNREVSKPQPGERIVTRIVEGRRVKGVVRVITMDLGNLTGTQARNITSAELIALYNKTEEGLAERVVSINVLKDPARRSAVAKRHLGPRKGRSTRRES